MVAGFDVEKDPYEVRKRLGYLPEHNPLYKNMYVREYLHFVAQLFHVSNIKNRVGEMIEMTGLTQEQHKLIRSLSKGYRQRVGLAQAMIHDPEVLILDEPTSGLDPNQLSEIRALIQSMGQDKTVLFSSHIMQEVEAICDRIIIINQGELVADESKEALKHRLQGSERVDVTFESSVDIARIKKIDGVVKVHATGEHSFAVWSSKGKDIRKSLFLFAANNGLIILEMNKATVSVESIFHHLTTN